jgi:hypothetical protein
VGERQRGRANEEGERARWEVEGEEASDGGWDLLRAYSGDRGPLGVATQLGKDFMHTAPFSCTAHLACLNVHMAKDASAGLVGSKLTVGHGVRVAHAWIGGCLRSEDCDALMAAIVVRTASGAMRARR